MGVCNRLIWLKRVHQCQREYNGGKQQMTRTIGFLCLKVPQSMNKYRYNKRMIEKKKKITSILERSPQVHKASIINHVTDTDKSLYYVWNLLHIIASIVSH